MLPGQEEEARRQYQNQQDDYTRVRLLKEQIAEILFYACSQACAQRGVHLDQRQDEELQNLLGRFV